MKTTPVITVDNLHKSFSALKVLRGINFSVKSGEILAILGPNGAGKTTTVRILATLLNQDKGTATVAGYDTLKEDDKVRACIGLTGQFAAVDEYLTGRENIRMIGQLYHMEPETIEPRVSELLKSFDLEDAADRPARTYSGGMKRRLDLAMSLVAAPPVLFLDEPTTGLDPRSRLSLWHMIKDLAKSGTTILLTTQYMDEADFLADNIIVIDNGTVIAQGTANQLKAKAGADKVEITFITRKDAQRAQEMLDGVSDVDNLRIHLPAKDGIASLKRALTTLEQANVDIDTASLRRPTLDDVFLALTGHDTSAEEEGDTK